MARDRIRAVPGHMKEGTGRASVWSVDRAKYHAHYAKKPSLRVVAPTLDDDAIAEAALREAGVRSTRRAS